jgi:3-oxoacyl-[acyl-carrier protein] reductase
MNLELKNKRALVCGSTKGIGKSAAIELALLGAEIILMARNEDFLTETLKELSTDAGQNHSYVCADFSDLKQLRGAAEKLSSEMEIHILVNNTGGPPAGPVMGATMDAFVQAFSNHLLCNQILVQAFVPGMKKNAYGRIINIISTSVKQPIRGLGVSNTIRAAVANWSKTLSVELAPFGITVNNVLPGATLTGRLQAIIDDKAVKSGSSQQEIQSEMLAEIPAGRFADPSEVAAAVAFLASPAAAYINGINLPEEGGRTLSL